MRRVLSKKRKGHRSFVISKNFNSTSTTTVLPPPTQLHLKHPPPDHAPRRKRPTPTRSPDKLSLPPRVGSVSCSSSEWAPRGHGAFQTRRRRSAPPCDADEDSADRLADEEVRERRRRSKNPATAPSSQKVKLSIPFRIHAQWHDNPSCGLWPPSVIYRPYFAKQWVKGNGIELR